MPLWPYSLPKHDVRAHSHSFSMFRWLVMPSLLLSFSIAPALADDTPLRMRTGGGNLVTHLTGPGSADLYQALGAIGAGLGRMDSYGWRDLAHIPTPENFDAAMLEAYRHKITPIILLEYEGSYQTLDPPQLIGSYSEWFETGVAYARRFQPGGEWAQQHGIDNYGATVFTAINEPDVQATIPKKDYHDALAGFADGIHSVNPSLRVVPGGFATCNSAGDPTLGGYGTAIADLLQSGQLDGIDLHTYYNARWFPLTKGREFSAQSCFDRVKAALGITRDINFYATEFNVSRDDAWTEPAVAARLFLTAIWDEFGVVGAGNRPATMLAFPWSLPDDGSIEGPPYAMATHRSPWAPDLRSKVLQTVLSLGGDMHFTALDPKGSGMFTLTDGKAVLHVWQDLDGWTDAPGTRWTVPVPDGATVAELWGWEGLRRTIKVKSGTEVTVEGLKIGETYMLLIR